MAYLLTKNKKGELHSQGFLWIVGILTVGICLFMATKLTATLQEDINAEVVELESPTYENLLFVFLQEPLKKQEKEEFRNININTNNTNTTGDLLYYYDKRKTIQDLFEKKKKDFTKRKEIQEIITKNNLRGKEFFKIYNESIFPYNIWQEGGNFCIPFISKEILTRKHLKYFICTTSLKYTREIKQTEKITPYVEPTHNLVPNVE